LVPPPPPFPGTPQIVEDPLPLSFGLLLSTSLSQKETALYALSLLTMALTTALRERAF